MCSHSARQASNSRSQAALYFDSQKPLSSARVAEAFSFVAAGSHCSSEGADSERHRGGMVSSRHAWRIILAAASEPVPGRLSSKHRSNGPAAATDVAAVRTRAAMCLLIGRM